MLMRFDPFRELAFRERDRITATYDQGVLTLVVPVAEQAKPRRLKITESGASQETAVQNGVTQGSTDRQPAISAPA